MSSCWLKSHLASLIPTCALKIDIRKYFYMVSWAFILTMLRAIGVPNFMVIRIEIRMSTAYFLMVMNGESHSLFPSFKGLLQGDPLSSYFFVLSIKVLGRFHRTRASDTTGNVNSLSLLIYVLQMTLWFSTKQI